MHERAKLVGGKLAVWSKLHSGTEIKRASRHRALMRRPESDGVRGFREKERRRSRERLFLLIRVISAVSSRIRGVRYAQKEVHSRRCGAQGEPSSKKTRPAAHDDFGLRPCASWV